MGFEDVVYKETFQERAITAFHLIMEVCMTKGPGIIQSAMFLHFANKLLFQPIPLNSSLAVALFGGVKWPPL